MKLVFLTLLILLIAFLATQHSSNPFIIPTNLFNSAHSTLLMSPPPRIAVGYNTNLDVIVNATDLLARLQAPSPHPHDAVEISSLEDLSDVLTYFLQNGAAAERHVSDPSLFSQLVDTSLSLPNAQIFVGGNAALMGQTLAMWGARVLLGGPVGKQLGSFLHPSIQLVHMSEEDQLHLIFEYQRNSQWRQSTPAPCPGRFICVRDAVNGELGAMEDLHAALPAFNPSLLVVSGLHLLPGLDAPTRDRRLDAVVAALDQTSVSYPIHLELASIAHLDIVAQIVERVLPLVDSLGLNDQELAAVMQSTDSDADIDGIRALEWPSVFRSLTQLFDHLKGSRLTRIHFHSLKFHAIIQRGDKWRSPGPVTAASSCVATLRACGYPLPTHDVPFTFPKGLRDRVLVPSDSSFVQAVARDAGLVGSATMAQISPIEWSVDDAMVGVSPVVTCENPSKTVGLGDAISSMGLLASLKD